MISRKVLFLDRIATLVLALLLIAGGLLGAWWWSGTSTMPSTTSTAPVTRTVAMEWWPWASAVVGIVLILLGLRWLLAHVRRTGVSDLTLGGSGSGGTLEADGSKVAGAAADALTHNLGVRSASGSVRRNRGQLVARLRATVDPQADLRLVAESADRVSAELAHVLGRRDLRCSVELKVARSESELPRAR